MEGTKSIAYGDFAFFHCLGLAYKDCHASMD